VADREDKKAGAALRTRSRRLCPFVREPCDDCLCSGTSSDSAEAAIRLCGGDFESCEIYRREKEEPP
jgi:hypothetical protein